MILLVMFKIPLQFEGVARSDGVAAGWRGATPPVGHPFATKGNLDDGHRTIIRYK